MESASAIPLASPLSAARWRPWALAAGLLFVLRLGLELGQEPSPAILGRLLELAQALLAATACATAAWRQRADGGRQALGWGLLAGAFACTALGGALAAAGVAAPGTDAAVLAFYPLFLLGVLLLPRAHLRAGEYPALLLDAAVVMIGSATLVWVLLVQPALGIGTLDDGPLLARVFAYPVGDLAALWAALALLTSRRGPHDRTACALLAAGAACLIATDLVYCRSMATGALRHPSWLGVGWSAASALGVLAGARRATCTPPPAAAIGGHRPPLLLPLAMGWGVLTAGWLAVSARGVGGLGEPGPLGVTAMLVLLLARLLLAAWEGNRLNLRLRHANASLEERVQARTLDLAAANAQLRAEIQERVQAEEALRRSEARFRHLVEHCPVGLAMWDAEGVIRAANPSFLALVGATADEPASGRLTWERLSPPGSGTHHLASASALLAGGRTEPEPRDLLALDGRHIPVLVGSVQLDDRGDGLFSTAVIDLSERRRLEADLERARRLEALGAVAGGVAHDFNNLLTVVIGYIELLLATTAPGSTRATLEAAQDAGRRASELARQLLTFARMGRTEGVDLDLAVQVAKARPLLQRLLGERIALVLDLPDRPIPMRADPSEIDQLLVNLAVNARDALGAGGHLTVRLVPRDDAAELTVADDGLGMDPLTRARCLEPFFSTKGPGRGTGLGLAIVQRVVQGLRGRIAIDSAPGEGTTFRITLPLAR